MPLITPSQNMAPVYIPLKTLAKRLPCYAFLKFLSVVLLSPSQGPHFTKWELRGKVYELPLTTGGLPLLEEQPIGDTLTTTGENIRI